jgi:hypothetical protein
MLTKWNVIEVRKVINTHLFPPFRSVLLYSSSSWALNPKQCPCHADCSLLSEPRTMLPHHSHLCFRFHFFVYYMSLFWALLYWNRGWDSAEQDGLVRVVCSWSLEVPARRYDHGNHWWCERYPVFHFRIFCNRSNHILVIMFPLLPVMKDTWISDHCNWVNDWYHTP